MSPRNVTRAIGDEVVIICQDGAHFVAYTRDTKDFAIGHSEDAAFHRLGETLAGKRRGQHAPCLD